MNSATNLFVGLIMGIHCGFIAIAYGVAWGMLSWLSLMGMIWAIVYQTGQL